MITVPEVVDELIRTSPYLEEALAQDILNLSALARRFKPQIQQKLYKDVQDGAIIMALKRLGEDLRRKRAKNKVSLAKITDITVRSNIVEYAYENSSTLDRRYLTLIQGLQNDLGSFFAFSKGVFETSFFTNSATAPDLEKAFKEEKLKAKLPDLSAITLILPKEAVYEPGIYYNIVKALAWQGISFVEVISSYTELTFFIEKDQVDQAFSALKNLN